MVNYNMIFRLNVDISLHQLYNAHIKILEVNFYGIRQRKYPHGCGLEDAI